MLFFAFNLENFTRAEFFYKGAAFGACDKYEVWLWIRVWQIWYFLYELIYELICIKKYENTRSLGALRALTSPFGRSGRVTHFHHGWASLDGRAFTVGGVKNVTEGITNEATLGIGWYQQSFVSENIWID